MFLFTRLRRFYFPSGGPFTPNRLSLNFRSKLDGIFGGVVGGSSAVIFSWYVFTGAAGPESFTFVPFLASVLLLTIFIPWSIQQAKERAQTQADLIVSGKQSLPDEIVNPWRAVIGNVCGLIQSFVLFLLLYLTV